MSKTPEDQLARAREWKRNHRAHCNAQVRAWKKANGGYMKWHREHPEKSRACREAWYVANKEKQLAQARIRSRAYHANNPNRHRRWQRDNRALLTARENIRRALKLKAMPPWADRDSIDKIYQEAARLTAKTGVKHDVDHIWPLQGKGFVGLHVPWNLQVLPHSVNCAKHNRRPELV